ALVRDALDGIRRLNQEYCAGGPDRFFLFHRRRLWNPSQNCWMGWERKRGKLHEFNRLLLGLTQARSASDGTVPSLALRACVRPSSRRLNSWSLPRLRSQPIQQFWEGFHSRRRWNRKKRSGPPAQYSWFSLRIPSRASLTRA